MAVSPYPSGVAMFTRPRNILTLLSTSAAGLMGLWSAGQNGHPPQAPTSHLVSPAPSATLAQATQPQAASLTFTAHSSSTAQAKGPAAVAKATPPPGQPLTGVLVPAKASEVVSPNSGTVEEVAVSLGEEVESGQLLVRMASEQAHLDLVRAEADQTAASASVERARVEVRHAAAQQRQSARLAREGLASREELSQARFRVAESRVRLREAESVLAERKARTTQLMALEHETAVTANFAGRIAQRYVDPGTRVEAGRPLLRLISTKELLLRFAIPETAPTAQFAIGQRVQVTAKEDKQARFVARIVHVAPEIDSDARMRFVEASPDDPDAILRSGLVGALMEVLPLIGSADVDSNAAGGSHE